MPLRARFFESGGVAESDDERALLELLLEQSPYLTELCIGAPALLRAVAADPHLRREKPAAAMLAEARAAVAAAAAPGEALRRWRGREYVRLGAREAGFGAFEEVGRELAHLADACFQAAIEATPGGDGLAVVAMGKHGGEELNFSSDVDVVYLYRSDEPPAPDGAAPHVHHARAADRVTRLVDEPTEHGRCFRVDLRLRPEGTRGPLANSLGALERYYETWGRPWERQAWIKARPAAGERAVAAEAIEMLAPFVYPRFVGPRVIDEVREMLARAQAQRRGQPGADERDLKLGPGGIREIEFFVQALQLLHGGKHPEVRARGTLDALDRLLGCGVISTREHRQLADAYVLLRRVENRLQLEQGLQTHDLPEDPARFALLARRLGLSAADLRDALAAHRAAVRAVWRTLGVEAEARPVDFARVPFSDRAAAEHLVGLLAARPASPFAPTAAAAAAAVAPVLVEELAGCADPDQALRHLVDFVSRCGAWPGVWELLDRNRALARLLISLFGTSDFLARRFVDWPEMLDGLLQSGRATARRSQQAIAADLADRVARAGDDPEEALRAMRRFKQEEELRIGLHDVAGALDLESLLDQLSALADALVQAALALVLARATSAPLAVLALGRLGARELDFGSDLDLVFVHAGASADDHARTARTAQRLTHALSTYMEGGRLYEIDTRLRPSGRQGFLVTTLDAFRAYHAGEAQVWERQALIKARVIAGDPALGEALEELRGEVVFARPLPEGARAEIARLRRRLEQDLGSPGEGWVDVKLGAGGLFDIEFVAQYLQLLHGGAQPALRGRRTVETLAALVGAGLLAAAAGGALAEAWRFLRRLEHRLRIVHDRASSRLRAVAPEDLATVALRMGYRGERGEAGARLAAELAATRSRVRAIYRDVLER